MAQFGAHPDSQDTEAGHDDVPLASNPDLPSTPLMIESAQHRTAEQRGQRMGEGCPQQRDEKTPGIPKSRSSSQNAVVDTIGMNGAPAGLLIDSTGARLYLTSATPYAVQVIDTEANRVIATIPVDSQPEPEPRPSS